MLSRLCRCHSPSFLICMLSILGLGAVIRFTQLLKAVVGSSSIRDDAILLPANLPSIQSLHHFSESKTGQGNPVETGKSILNLTSTEIGSHPLYNVSLPMCLVHVGKAAGSSVSCGLGFAYADCEGMPRPKINSTYFFHMKRNQCAQKNTSTYLVTLRNPLTRIRSWFEFEKDILPVRKNRREEEQIRRKRALLFQDCYTNFTSFVEDGLLSLVNYTVDARTPPSMSCPQRAWAALLGVRAISYHEWYNYEHYWNGIHQGQNASMKVLRLEHINEDWASISTEPMFRHVNQGSRQGAHKATTKLETLSKAALAVLCDGLCYEIQFYKQFLRKADNLGKSEVDESMNEMMQMCPSETIHIRDCPPVPSFPPMQVPKHKFQGETKQRLFQISKKGQIEAPV